MLRISLKPALIALAFTALPSLAQACACGCSIFDVGTASMLPSGLGTTLFLEYDFLNQTTNWSGGSSAPGANNDDMLTLLPLCHRRTPCRQNGSAARPL